MLLQKEDLAFFFLTITIAILILLVFFFLSLGFNWRLRTKRKEELYKVVIDTEEKERDRLAQDLHDDINPILSALKMELETIALRTWHNENKVELMLVADKLNSTIQDVRDLARSMSSATVRHQGLIKGLENFGNSICKSAGVQFSFFHETLPHTLSEYSQSTLYRILQELIVNSIRHSGCTEIELSVSVEPDELFIEYSDDGKKGLDLPVVRQGIGLTNIASRVQLLRGQMVAPESFKNGCHYTFSFKLKNLQ